MNEDYPEIQGLACPLPLTHQEMIVMGHGSGGKLMHDLITRRFLPHFENPILRTGDDAGKLTFPTPSESPLKLAISTDSHVVWPLFFPGGDIGRLAVCGTVNDISMLGAYPTYLTAGFILEEGLPVTDLERVLKSMQEAANEAGVQIVAGDTKVVQKGKADGLYINTAGIGIIDPTANISGTNAIAGDSVIISGSIGDHGIAVLEARGELGFTSGVLSDVAPLNHLIASLLQSGCHIHVLRDPTRGGLATTLNEITHQSKVSILLEEACILIKPAVSAACEMLGFDPLYIANEGKMIVILPAEEAPKALEILRATQYGQEAVAIGKVLPDSTQRVLMKTVIGTTRIVDVLSGELLPRIC